MDLFGVSVSLVFFAVSMVPTSRLGRRLLTTTASRSAAPSATASRSTAACAGILGTGAVIAGGSLYLGHHLRGNLRISSAEDAAEELIVHPLRDGISRMSTYSPYLAYSSDIGEAFRQVTSACVVKSSYGLAGLYIVADIGYNGYKEYTGQSEATAAPAAATDIQSEGTAAPAVATDTAGGDQVQADDETLSVSKRVGLTVAHATVYQGLASLLIPYLVIHNAVHHSESKIFSRATSPFFRSWGPSIVALAIIPFLPLVDGPVESAVDWAFDHAMPHRREQEGEGKEEAKE